jgi:hypothetical protein
VIKLKAEWDIPKKRRGLLREGIDVKFALNRMVDCPIF